MVAEAGTPGDEAGGPGPRRSDGSLQPPVFNPPLALPAVQSLEDDDEDSGTRKRVLWAFGAAAALFGAGVVGLALPANSDDGIDVSTDDTADTATTVPGPRSEEDVRTLVAPVFAPFTFSAAGPANATTSTTDPGLLSDDTSARVSVLAGVIARGTTGITLKPLPPATNQSPPTVAPGNPVSGTTTPTRPTTTNAPPTTGPPRPPRTTTTTTAPTTAPTTIATIPTTPPTDPPPTTEPTTTTTEPSTTIADTTTTTTTTTTEAPTTIAETTTTAGTTTILEPPTSPETAPTLPLP